MYIWIY